MGRTKGTTTTYQNRYGTFTKDCPTIRGIINKICGENRVMYDDAEAMIEHFHRWAVDAMASETYPNVLIPNFGRFNINPLKIKMRILMSIKFYRTGVYTYEKVCSIIKRLYPMYKRAHKEHLLAGRGISRLGGTTRKSLSRLIAKKMKRDWIKT